MSAAGSLHEPGQQPNQLVQLFVAAGTQVIGHTGAHVLGQQLLGKAVQRRVHRCHLYQNIHTVGILFQHAAHAAHLPFDAAQPVDQCFVFLRAAVLVAAAGGDSVRHIGGENRVRRRLFGAAATAGLAR